MLRQEETMCQENNAKWLGFKILDHLAMSQIIAAVETHANYFTCVYLAHCTLNTIFLPIHIFVLFHSLCFGPKESVYHPKMVWLSAIYLDHVCWAQRFYSGPSLARDDRVESRACNLGWTPKQEV